MQEAIRSNLDSLTAFAPELALIAGLILILLVGLGEKGGGRDLYGGLALLTLAVAFGLSVWLLATLDAPRPLFAGLIVLDPFALFFKLLLSVATGHDSYRPVSRFPAIIRDMALVVDAAVPQRQIADIIGGFPLVDQVTLFDVYSGEQLPAGRKSLAYRVGYQSPDHTLTDGEVDKVQKKIINKLSSETGAVLRG